ncbi:MAG TPA: CsbD family protein [Acetobacteraceae bacterium]|nr:CsbD family protein [Acetobacteraceae bacterium]
MSDRFEGTARELGGRVQQKVGEFAGDAKTQASGLYNQAAGQAEQQVAKLSDVIKDQPITSALVAIGIGYLLGRFTA